MSKNNRIIQILMQRDNMTEQEAKARFQEVNEMVQDAITSGNSYDEVEDIMSCELGLEMDYIDDILF